MSRIMIASAKMRYFRIRGRGELRGGGEDEDEAEAIDEIKICNAHLHYMTAKREVWQRGGSVPQFLGSPGAIPGLLPPQVFVRRLQHGAVLRRARIAGTWLSNQFGRVVLLAESSGGAGEVGLLRNCPHWPLPGDSDVFRCICVWPHIPEVPSN